MKKIVFIGGGALSEQIIHFIGESSDNEYYFFDDCMYEKKVNNSFPFLSYKTFDFSGYEIIISLGYKHLRQRLEILDYLNRKNFKLIKYIHPSCCIESSAKIGTGTILYPMNNIDPLAIIEQGVIINSKCSICHNVRVGRGTFIASGVLISGFSSVGERNFIGAGVNIANNISIGDDCIIGIGTVVTKDIPDGASVIGNPMRILKKPLQIN